MSRNSGAYHNDTELFRAALSFTQSETGFSARLIEKDYYCSLVLADLSAVSGPSCVFKGGTCLSKVHGDFYRMSEDLDFAYAAALDAPRAQRSRMIVPMKQHLAKLAKRLPCFSRVDLLRGFNNSTQYVASLNYRSVATGHDGSIKLEFSIREPILEPVEHRPARALLLDPFRHATAIAPVNVAVLSCREAYSEKLRAALTRREPAIRDFYDIDHAVRSGRLNTHDPLLIGLVQSKVAVPGNAAVDLSKGKRGALMRQVDSQLRSVLRDADFNTFDLERAFGIVAEVAASLTI